MVVAWNVHDGVHMPVFLRYRKASYLRIIHTPSTGYLGECTAVVSISCSCLLAETVHG